MKKLMIALAVVAFATASQAAKVNWFSSDMPTGVALADLNGNTTVAANGAGLPYIAGTAMNFALSVYSQDGSTLIGSGAGSLAYDDMDDTISVSGISVSGDFVAGTTYKYIATITGKQGNMATYTDANWDYSAASLTATVEGTFTGKTGVSTIMSDVPTSWTVSGAVENVPEPTSGLLLLLGVAGLALRRRRA